MQRIVVIGCPGSGKSTLARALHERTGIPLYHLDMLYWNEDKTTVDKATFRSRLAAVLREGRWIIDGNYSSTMEERIALSDTVIFLDYPTELCLEGVRQRRGMPRSDMPWIELEEDTEFIKFIESFATAERPKILALLDRYAPTRTVHIFKTREEAERFFANTAFCY